jgi:hypothetical protein
LDPSQPAKIISKCSESQAFEVASKRKITHIKNEENPNEKPKMQKQQRILTLTSNTNEVQQNC